MLCILKNFACTLVSLNSENSISSGCFLFAELDGETQRRELSVHRNDYRAGAAGMVKGM